MTDPQRMGAIEPRPDRTPAPINARRLAEVAKLLAIVAKFDNRSWNEATVNAWALALDGLDYARCEAAILKHFRETDKWLMPAHIRQLAKTTTGTGATCPTCRTEHRPSQPCPDQSALLGGVSDGMWRRAIKGDAA